MGSAEIEGGKCIFEPLLSGTLAFADTLQGKANPSILHRTLSKPASLFEHSQQNHRMNHFAIVQQVLFQISQIKTATKANMAAWLLLFASVLSVHTHVTEATCLGMSYNKLGVEPLLDQVIGIGFGLTGSYGEFLSKN